MIVLGVTGSMAMGKSTITKMLRLIYRIPVWDADQAVRDLLVSDDELIQEIAIMYPQVMVNGKIDRSLLRSKAFEDEDCLVTLERLIHEKAFSQGIQFLSKMHRLGVPLCVFDVPLLFEAGWDRVCTYTVLVYAPTFIQRQRLQKRPDLNEAKIERILKRHWSLDQKKALASYEIQTGLSKWNTFRQLSSIIKDVKSKQVHDA
jgi:dephospho-CoA kinase